MLQSNVQPKISHALQMARYGFPVHPCKPGTKKPHLEGYKDLATTNQGKIRVWWQKWPDAEIGIILDDTVIVVDVDRGHPDGNDGYASLKTLEKTYTPLPYSWATYSGATSEGEHRYYRLPRGVKITGCTKIAPGLEVLGHRWPVIAPGSVHPRGSIYQWDEFLNPQTMPITEAPDWLTTLVQQQHKPKTVATPQTDHARSSRGDSKSYAVAQHAGLTGQEIKAFFTKESVIRQCLPHCGIAVDIPFNTSIRCPLPGHGPDRSPSAYIASPTQEHPTYLFVCHHAKTDKGERKGIAFPELFYMHVTGHRAGVLPKASFVMWATRLLVVAGVLQPVPITPPKLWPSAPAHAQEVLDGFVALLETRSLIGHKDAPYTWKFCVSWLGTQLTEYAIAPLMKWLIAKAYLVPHIRDKLTFFRLGSRSARLKRKAAPVFLKQTDIITDVEKDMAELDKQPVLARHAGQKALQVCTVCGVISNHLDGQCVHCRHRGDVSWLAPFAAGPPLAPASQEATP